MISTCPVCGAKIDPLRAVLESEEETYRGAEGAEMKIRIPYCNVGSACTPVLAANMMDKMAEPFTDLLGRR